jgi:DNA-binding transcriptional MerR regulator
VTDLNIVEAAEALGVPHGTLKGWLRKVPIPLVEDPDGHRRVSPEGVEMLRHIKAMRLEQGWGFGRIRSALGLNSVETDDEPGESNTEPVRDQGAAMTHPALVAQVIEAIQEQTALAEKFARATHRIGQLEAEGEALRLQIVETRQLLTDGGEKAKGHEVKLATTAAENAELRQLLTGEQQLRARVEGERDQLRAFVGRPWWRRLLG